MSCRLDLPKDRCAFALRIKESSKGICCSGTSRCVTGYLIPDVSAKIVVLSRRELDAQWRHFMFQKSGCPFTAAAKVVTCTLDSSLLKLILHQLKFPSLLPNLDERNRLAIQMVKKWESIAGKRKEKKQQWHLWLSWTTLLSKTRFSITLQIALWLFK